MHIHIILINQSLLSHHDWIPGPGFQGMVGFDIFPGYFL